MKNRLLRICVLILLCTLSGYASAEIVDDILLKNNAATDEIDAVIKFNVPIQYVRHFPQQKSSFLVISFNILDKASPDQWLDYETRKSPPSDFIYGFTVTTRDVKTGPKVEIQFMRTAEYSVTAGRDGRSLLVHIKPIVTTVVPEAAAVVKPMQQRVEKDDLPPFPEIAKVAPEAGAVKAPDSLSPAGADAALMLKARGALFSGELFAAIDLFNSVLKLPPNKYSQDAQLWIGIAREKSGQAGKAKLEYESYLKFYPDGGAAKWVKARLAKLNATQPPASVKQAVTLQERGTSFQTSAYGSYSMYYYHGDSTTDTTMSDGTKQTMSLNDQSSLISNVSATARSFNNEFDNRLVFQDFYSKSFLPNQLSKNRLNAAFFEVKNRVNNYSARIGRQSALGGGVLGRFDGISAGYGFLTDWRANVVAGQLTDTTLGQQPVFGGASLDFGVKSSVGGTLYAIKQTVGQFTDREAVGGYLRYFKPRVTAMLMLDYDTQFGDMNMATLQGSYNGESGTDFNFLFDRRKSPSLSLRSAVNGTVSTLDTLVQNGWTIDDLLSLAKSRTAISNLGQVGMTNRLSEKWQIGTDITVTNTSELQNSGTLLTDGTVGLEGFVPASAATSDTWSINERLIGEGVFSDGDISMCSAGYTKSNTLEVNTLLLNNHSYVHETWAHDETLRLYWQTDSTGGKQVIFAPVFRLGYKLKKNLVLETEIGVDLTTSKPNELQTTNSTRTYSSMGFRHDF